MREVASLVKQKDYFTWPGEHNATHVAKGLYFALQTMNKFLLQFLRGYYCNAEARRFGSVPEKEDSLKQFYSSNQLFFFSFLSPTSLLMCLFTFWPSPMFYEYIHCRLRSLQPDPLLSCPKGLLVQNKLHRTSPIGSISVLSKKILLMFSSLRPFHWGWKTWFKFQHHSILKKTKIVIQMDFTDLWIAQSFSLPKRLAKT